MSRLQKRLLSLLAVFVCLHTLPAQGLGWIRSIGGSGSDNPRYQTTDAAGNLYVVSNFVGTADLDPGPGVSLVTSAGSIDIFFCKMDPSGNLVFSFTLGSTAQEFPMAIAIDPSGNILLSGFFQATVDFDPGPGVYNMSAPVPSTDGFLLKLSPTGTFIWARQISSEYTDEVTSLAVDDAGNIFAGGSFSDTVDFDPGPGVYQLIAPVVTAQDGFVMKMTPAGNLAWARRCGGIGLDEVNAITYDDANGIYATGNFVNTADFNPNPLATYNLSSAGGSDVFMLKLDSSGIFNWAFRIGANLDDFPRALTIDTLDRVYVSGVIQGSNVDFDPGAGSYLVSATGTYDGFLARYTSAGALSYAKSWGAGGTTITFANHHDTDPEGATVITGQFTTTLDADPGAGTVNLVSNGGNDCFIVKLDENGNHSSSFNIGGTSNEIGYSVIWGDAGRVNIAGSFQGTTDFNPSSASNILTPIGSVDAFMVAINDCGPVSETLTVDGCSSYTLNSITYVASGTFTQLRSSVLGCDSTIILNLTLHGTSGSTVTLANCDSVVVNSVSYLTTGTYYQHFTDMYGCDSTLTINATVHGVAVGAITTAACDSFTLNAVTYTTTGLYEQWFTSTIGCDSVLYLSLTINSVDTAVTLLNDSTASANSPGATFQWINCLTGLAVPGATSATFTPDASGSYAVAVTQGACSDTSACYPLTILVSSEAPQHMSHTTVRPNPSQGEVALDLMGWQGIVQLRLTDALGFVLNEWHVDSRSSIPIQLPSTSGIYFLEVRRPGHAAEFFKLVRM